MPIDPGQAKREAFINAVVAEWTDARIRAAATHALIANGIEPTQFLIEAVSNAARPDVDWGVERIGGWPDRPYLQGPIKVAPFRFGLEEYMHTVIRKIAADVPDLFPVAHPPRPSDYDPEYLP